MVPRSKSIGLELQRNAALAIIARIRAEVDQYADGAIDASAHDQLANDILGMLPPEIAIA